MLKEKFPILITEDTLKFKTGQILENYEFVEDGVAINEDYLNESKFILLTEKLSTEDEIKVREIIRFQMKKLFWNLYTKNSILI